MADDQGSESGRAGESRAPRESNDQVSADLRHLHRWAPRSERKRPHRRGAPSGAGSGGEPSGCHGGAERHRRAPWEPEQVQRWIEPTTQKAVVVREGRRNASELMRRAVLARWNRAKKTATKKRG